MKKIRVILSGGGTGGHIYPAVATAEALVRQLGPEGVELLFVGAEGKMEMEKVPALGYKIVGLPVAGLQRKLTLSNLALPFKLLRSMIKARRTVRQFRPDVAIGFGGYASGPILKAAQKMGIPTVLQEQNSFAGVTNKLLAKRAEQICVAYEGMERFFLRMKQLLKPGGCIYMDSSDLKYLFEDEDGSYLIDVAGDYYGMVDFRMQYKQVKGEAFDWLYIDFDTLAYYAEQYGFRAELVSEGEHYDYLAALSIPQ